MLGRPTDEEITEFKKTHHEFSILKCFGRESNGGSRACGSGSHGKLEVPRDAAKTKPLPRNRSPRFCHRRWKYLCQILSTQRRATHQVPKTRPPLPVANPQPPKAKVSKATLREPPVFLIREQKAWIRAEHGGEYCATFERERAPECEHLLARRHVAHILSVDHTPEGTRSFVNRAFDIHLEGEERLRKEEQRREPAKERTLTDELPKVKFQLLHQSI